MPPPGKMFSACCEATISIELGVNRLLRHFFDVPGPTLTVEPPKLLQEHAVHQSSP